MESEDCYAVGGARALLNCPLPPELEVGFKCRIITPEPEVMASDVSKITISQVQPGEYHHRVLDSEDSSYDSDYDFPRSTSGASSVHDSVSRTTSETLDGELKNESDSDSEGSDSESFTNPEDFNYLNYSFKLGFTEEQARAVLKKIGPNPPRDQFLNGLLQLGNSGSSQPVIAKHEEAPGPVIVDPTPVLRYIVIDGSNVAMTHGNKEKFSCKGIQLCVQWFLARGHKNITVFVPAWRKEASTVEAPISDRKILLELEKEKLLVFTPSRQSPDGRRIICYDDRYILQTAKDNDAIVVSNDNYRDLAAECPEYRTIIEKRILMYSFVNDRFMPPDDPLGRSGPKLEQFLRKTPAQPCPYNGRCTYGNKCKYFHPERGNVPQKSIVEQLAENTQKKQREAVSKKKVTRDTPTRSLNPETGKKSLQRTYSTAPVVSLPRGVTEDRPVRGSSPNPSNFNSIGHHKFTVPPPPISSEEGVNPHRKVTRELSLLPDDQRITSLRHGGLAPPFPPPQISAHPQVFRHQSAPFALPTTNQARSPLRNVESAEKIRPLDLRVPPPVVTHPWAGRTSSLPPYNFALPAVEKKRQEIALHLKAILPVELVEEAMSMMPEETDAVKICAAISQLAIGQKPINRM